MLDDQPFLNRSSNATAPARSAASSGSPQLGLDLPGRSAEGREERAPEPADLGGPRLRGGGRRQRAVGGGQARPRVAGHRAGLDQDAQEQAVLAGRRRLAGVGRLDGRARDPRRCGRRARRRSRPAPRRGARQARPRSREGPSACARSCSSSRWSSASIAANTSTSDRLSECSLAAASASAGRARVRAASRRRAATACAPGGSYKTAGGPSRSAAGALGDARAASARARPRGALARGVELALPVRGDAQHAGALDPQDVVAGALAGARSRSPKACAASTSPRVRAASASERTSGRRARSRAGGECQGALVHAHEALRAIAVEGYERAGSAVRIASSRSSRALLGGRSRHSASARSSTRAAPAWSCRRCAASAAYEYHRTASSATPAASWCAAIRRSRRRGPHPGRAPARALRAVVMAALGRAQGLVGGLADAAVAEVVGVEPLGAHDAAPPELVEAADEALFVALARVGQHGRRELAADRRGDPGELAGRGGQAGEPRRDHGLHLAAGRLGRPPGRPRRGTADCPRSRRTAGPSRPRRGASGHPLGQQAGLGAAQPLAARSPSARSSAAGPASARPTGCCASISSRRAVAATSSGAAPCGAQQVVQELERRAVEPLQVVGDQQQRRPGREDRLGERSNSRWRCSARAERLRGDRRARAAGARARSGVRAVEPAQARRRAARRAQPGDDRPVGERRPRRGTSGPRR